LSIRVIYAKVQPRGIANAFGTFQTYYELELLQGSSPSDIAWIGSVQSWLLLFVGALSGPIYDAGYARALIIGGSFFSVFGQMMLSLCDNYWQIFLAQGICVGIGGGMLCMIGNLIASQYFTTKLSTATGIAAAGSSLGEFSAQDTHYSPARLMTLRRCHLSHRLPQASAHRRLRMGYSCHRFHHSGSSTGRHSSAET
jgi:hypothetical protein